MPDLPSDEIAFVDLASQRARLEPALSDAIQNVLCHARFIMGPEVEQLEEELAAWSGAAAAVSCASGTDALLLALMALDLGAGEAVVVPSFTFAATAEVVALLGAVPVFADCAPATFNIDGSTVDDALATARGLGLRARAVVAVDLFGHPAGYTELEAVADAASARLIADAAQSFGGSRDGRQVGSLAPVTTTSFFPAKPLGCYGDGGAVLCTDPEIARRIASIRVHGQGEHKYDHVRVGTNARMDTLQAAVLLHKLRIFGDELVVRRALASRYDYHLRGRVETPTVDEGVVSTWAQYTVLIDERDRVASELAGAGVPTAVYYPVPLHMQPAYRAYPSAPRMNVAEALAGRVLSLPIHPYLTEAQQDHVIEALLATLRV